MKEEEKSIRDGEKSKLNSSSSLSINNDKAKKDTYEAPATSSSSSSLSGNMTKSEWGACRTEAWQCFSSNMEEGVRNLHRPNDFVGSIQHLLYKAVFHGGLKSMWSSVMELPSARGLGSCLSGHDRCIEHTVLAREVDSAGW